MAEPKPIASLSAGLLARKGAARPAMRRQTNLPGGDLYGFEDLGWSDMGDVVDPQDDITELGRAAAHYLSPMGHAHAETQASVAQQLDAVVERAIAEPAGSALAERAEPAMPVVRLQQQAIVAALSPAPDVVAPAETHLPVAAEPVASEAVAAEPVASEAVAAEPVAVLAKPVAGFAGVTAKQVPAKSGARAQAGSRGNFAFTLRLDPARHLRLRIASAANNRSTQQILINLIDDYLSERPEIDAFAAQLPASKRQASV